MAGNEKGIVHLIPLIIGTIIFVVLIVVIINFMGGGSKQPLQAPREVATSGATATAAAQVKTNPFDTYRNPFEKYTNPFSQFAK